jgi:transposase
MSYLAGRCHDGRRTVREIVQDLFDVPVALGTVIAYEHEVSAALARPCDDVVQQVRAAPVKYVDETGWKRGGGQRCWLWTCATARAAAFAIQADRNWSSLCNLLGTRRGGRGIIGCDRWHAYARLGRRRRQVCWAHLKRDFQKWFDLGNQTRLLGEQGLELCTQVFALWRDFRQRRGQLTRRQLQLRLSPLRRRLAQVLRWALRCGHAPATTFCRKLLAIQPALWTFARVAGVEPTNNAAERALRPAVLWRKNSFGCHSEAGCRFAERMLTAVQSLRLQGRGVLAWLAQIVTAHRAGLPGPTLC